MQLRPIRDGKGPQKETRRWGEWRCQSFQNPGQQGLRGLHWDEGAARARSSQPHKAACVSASLPSPTGNSRAQPLNRLIQTPALWKVPLLPATLPLQPEEPGYAGCPSPLLRCGWRQVVQWAEPAIPIPSRGASHPEPTLPTPTFDERECEWVCELTTPHHQRGRAPFPCMLNRQMLSNRLSGGEGMLIYSLCLFCGINTAHNITWLAKFLQI